MTAILYMNTMGQILQENWKIICASLFAIALIVGAFLLAQGVQSPPKAQASEETAILKAIASKDADSDGLPDWEEALYGTDPKNPDTRGLGMTDGEAVAKGLIVPKADVTLPAPPTDTSPQTIDSSLPAAPAQGTLTAAFSQQFFTLYLAAREQNGGEDLSEEQLAAVSQKAISNISATIKATPDFKSPADLQVMGSGGDALIAFAASAEGVLTKVTASATTTEITYLKSLLTNEDKTAIPHIASIAKAYRDSATGLAVLPVPQELLAADTALINSLMKLGQVINDFTLVDSDPVVAMLAINQYGQAVQNLAASVAAVGQVYQDAHISAVPGTPGAGVITAAEALLAKQRTAPQAR